VVLEGKAPVIFAVIFYSRKRGRIGKAENDFASLDPLSLPDGKWYVYVLANVRQLEVQAY
jgi:hypothetical protein